VGQVDDQRRGPGADPVLAVRADIAAGFVVFPDRRARGFVDGQEKLPLTRTAPENGEVAVQDRRRGVAPDVLQLAQVAPPQLLALKIVTDESGGAEAGEDTLAIRDRRCGTKRVGRMRGLLLLVHDVLAPEESAIRTVEAEEPTAVSRGWAAGP